MDIERYAAVRPGQHAPADGRFYDDVAQARQLAQDWGCQLVAYRFVLADSELLEDYGECQEEEEEGNPNEPA